MKRTFLVAILLGHSWLHELRATDAEPDLIHGNKQVQQMLSDRPAMALFATKDGSLKKLTPEDLNWQWAATAFGKRINGATLAWDNHEVSKPLQYLCEHVIPGKDTNGSVRIRETFMEEGHIRKATFDEMWAGCIFELINITNADKFLQIYRDAFAGKVTREGWVRLNTELEYSALTRLKTFFEEVWIPWSQKNNHPYESLSWTRNTPATYAEWISQYQDSELYKYWENYYDTSVVPYLKKVEESHEH